MGEEVVYEITYRFGQNRETPSEIKIPSFGSHSMFCFDRIKSRDDDRWFYELNLLSNKSVVAAVDWSPPPLKLKNLWTQPIY